AGLEDVPEEAEGDTGLLDEARELRVADVLLLADPVEGALAGAARRSVRHEDEGRRFGRLERRQHHVDVLLAVEAAGALPDELLVVVAGDRPQLDVVGDDLPYEDAVDQVLVLGIRVAIDAGERALAVAVPQGDE